MRIGRDDPRNGDAGSKVDEVSRNRRDAGWRSLQAGTHVLECGLNAREDDAQARQARCECQLMLARGSQVVYADDYGGKRGDRDRERHS